MKQPIPPNERKRLSVLESYNILDTPSEESFDRITRLASALIGTPIAVVSLLDSERQWFKSTFGIDAQETPRDLAFCAHAIMEPDVLVVPDALLDPRFSDNPLVIGDPKIRFYAGAPLKAPGGVNLGTLCIIDMRPRQIDEREKRLLQDLAAVAIDELELRRLAATDYLTGAYNRTQFLDLAEREIRRARRYGHALSIGLIDIDDFKRINRDHGIAIGDMALKTLAGTWRRLSREHDIIGRYAGADFMVVLPHTDLTEAMTLLERIRREAAGIRIPLGAESLGFTVSIGAAELDAELHTLDEGIKGAYKALSEAKANGRNRLVPHQAA